MKSLMMSLPLLLLLLLPAVRAAPFQGASLRTELRCQCINTVSEFIPVKKILTVKLSPEGPHCPNVEVIATLKDGFLACLNPEEKWVKKIVNHILNRQSHKL
ncbi:growth-regulated alpha protein-like [Rhinatrema bivittatum]|uniref:growth-regulated alpha protein-like n=1 Tax=Rhinatrema bivittatum TaxID=194408 RepID=UPI00112A05C0|nr:growth-regulated alpha protein-like [Rhinatrema bivittatum]